MSSAKAFASDAKLISQTLMVFANDAIQRGDKDWAYTCGDLSLALARIRLDYLEFLLRKKCGLPYRPDAVTRLRQEYDLMTKQAQEAAELYTKTAHALAQCQQAKGTSPKAIFDRARKQR